MKIINNADKSPHSQTYHIFLGFKFRSSFYKRAELIKIINASLQSAQQRLRKLYPNVTLRLDHQITGFGKPVNAQIVRMVRRASVAIFEVSERNPNVYFEMGLAYGRGASEPMLLLNKRAEKRDVVASDVKDLYRLHYKNKRLDLDKENISSHIVNQIKKRICVSRYDMKRIWGISTRRITIICPTLTKKYVPEHAQRNSPEFVKFAKCGDPDALVEVLTLIRTLFPKICSNFVLSKQDQQCREDLIILGGPDFNQATKEFMKVSKCPIQYKVTNDDGVAFVHKPSKKEYRLVSKKGGQEFQDYGFFSRFPNPFNSSKKVILIGGLGTQGVLGAVEAFGNNPIGRENIRKIIDDVSENPHFLVLIPVNVSRSHTPLPRIDITTLCKYPW